MEDEVLENHDCVTLRHELERSAKKRMIVMRQKDMVEIVRVTLALKALTKRPTSKLLMTVQDLAHFHNSLERLLGLHQPAKVTYNLKVRRAWKVYFAFLMHIQDVPNMNTRGYKKIVVRALSEYAIFLNINMHTRTITVHETIELFRNKVKDWFRHPFLVSKVVVRSRFDNEAVMRIIDKKSMAPIDFLDDYNYVDLDQLGSAEINLQAISKESAPKVKPSTSAQKPKKKQCKVSKKTQMKKQPKVSKKAQKKSQPKVSKKTQKKKQSKVPKKK